MADKLPEYVDFLEERGIDSIIFLPFEIGKTYYFRAAVYSMIGRVTGYAPTGNGGGFVRLEDASYVGTDGRFGQFCAGDVESSETEYCGTWNISVAALNDFGEWPHVLPTESR